MREKGNNRLRAEWNYKDNEARYGWFDDYLYPGEHRGQVSHRAAVARNRINKIANDTGLKRERVKHMYDIHKYDDQPGEPTATSTRAQQTSLKSKQTSLGNPKRLRDLNAKQTSLGNPKGLRDLEKTDTRKKLEKAFKTKK